MELVQVGELGKGVLVAQWDVDHAVVDKSGHGCDGSALLTTSLSPGADEQTNVFAKVATSLPLATCAVNE